MESLYNINPGIVAVFLGVIMFVMGYWKGYSNGKASIPFDMIISSAVDNLVKNGFIKMRRQMVDGKLEDVILKHDEE
ncbi:hypothetical protein N8072_01455 [bacterium]|nr:hypothetical protein [bacterium]MDB4128595.1 hypothetical protein [bacterium]MDC1257320.1 hypothetical protein [bacterium]